jgi:hypothetical protein
MVSCCKGKKAVTVTSAILTAGALRSLSITPLTRFDPARSEASLKLKLAGLRMISPGWN